VTIPEVMLKLPPERRKPIVDSFFIKVLLGVMSHPRRTPGAKILANDPRKQDIIST